MRNPPATGELRAFNRITETFSVDDLADRIIRVERERGYDVTIGNAGKPRVEKEEHCYNSTYTGLKELGLKPQLLIDDVFHGMFEQVEQYRRKMDEHEMLLGIKR